MKGSTDKILQDKNYKIDFFFSNSTYKFCRKNYLNKKNPERTIIRHLLPVHNLGVKTTNSTVLKYYFGCDYYRN